MPARIVVPTTPVAPAAAAPNAPAAAPVAPGAPVVVKVGGTEDAAVAALQALRASKTTPPPAPPVPVAPKPPAEAVKPGEEGDEEEAAEEPGTEEGAPAEPKEPKAAEPKDAFSERFHALRREQAKLTAERTGLKTEREKLETERTELAKHRQLIDDLKSGALEDPAKLFELLSMDDGGKRSFYEQLAAYFAAGGKVTPEMQARANQAKASKQVLSKVEELEKKLADERAEKERIASERQQTEVRSGIADRITKAGEEFEFLAREGEDGVDLVFTMAQTLFAEAVEAKKVTRENAAAIGEQCIADALKKSEAHFEAEFESKLTLKKAKRKIPAVPAPTPTQDGRETAVGQPGSSSKTLTNSLTAEVPTSRRLEKTEDEQIDDAVEALRKAREAAKRSA